jgi:hypothetical protein
MTDLGPILWKNRAGGAVLVLCDLRSLDQTTYPQTSGTAGRGYGGAETAAAFTASGYFNVGTTAGTGTIAFNADELGQCVRIQVTGVVAPTVLSNLATMWAFPTWQNFTLVPASLSERRRFTLSGYIQMRAASTGSEYSFGLHSNGSMLDAGGAGCAGIEVVYAPLTSPNWFLRTRVTPLAAVVLGANSGVPAVSPTPAFVEFIYTEGVNATLIVKVNGVQLGPVITGAGLPAPAAAFPIAANIGLGAWYGGGKTLGTTADGDFRIRRLRYLVEELAA